MKSNRIITVPYSTADNIPTVEAFLAPQESSESAAQARHQAIEEAAYWRAEERAFAPGGELDDWLGAEASFEGEGTGSLRV